jgi:hypothetical protein
MKKFKRGKVKENRDKIRGYERGKLRRKVEENKKEN